MKKSHPTLPLLCLFIGISWSLSSCQPTGLHVGETIIPKVALERAASEMGQTYSQFGQSTLFWEMLREGWGPAWILHSQLPEESALARQQSLETALLLHRGANFEALARKSAGLGLNEDPADYPRAPNPHNLGGRAAAAVAALEEGEWAGPLRTLKGWELVYLRRRFEGHRTRAGVQVVRLIHPVGSAVSQEKAKEMWTTLPLGGSQALLDSLPASFRHGRIEQDS